MTSTQKTTLIKNKKQLILESGERLFNQKTSIQIRSEHIKNYIQTLKNINISAIIHTLSPSALQKLIEQAKQKTNLSTDNDEKDEKIVQIMIDIQLNKTIGQITAIELKALKSKNKNITTYRCRITEYRKEIEKLLDSRYRTLQIQYKIRRKKLLDTVKQKCLAVKELEQAIKDIRQDKKLMAINKQSAQIQKQNPVSRIAQIALYKMTAGKIVHQQIESQYEEKKRQRQKKYKLINTHEYIKIATGLLQSNYYNRIILGICALTGRRPIEVVKTGKFLINDDYSMVFSGQAKKRLTDTTKYIIPVLCHSNQIIPAHKKLQQLLIKKGIDYVNDDNISIKNRILSSKREDQQKKHIFKSIYPTGIENQTFNLRSIYTRICYDIFQPNMSFSVYTAQILNHANLDSAASYDQYKSIQNYEKTTLQNHSL